jgi:Ni/Fe-hydrogenase subunit HybB-like protein
MIEGRSRVLNPIKDVLWALTFAGLAAGAGRFAFGLGASTNMMDSLPWGWWKIFNMVAGAALATSGFVVASIIYIFQIDRYRDVARLSVLVGFLGYGSSLAALLFDIGLPHRGWHPFFMWNPHSFLFEVFWCVSLYWGVTALELIPILTERFPLQKITHWMHEKMLPFVVLGITLSTMHHSSLGSLFMASPTRLYPLWHSLWIPPEFFVSAMGAGLSVIVLLILVSSALYGRKRDPTVLNGLARGSAVLLAIYLVVKGLDFTANQKWNFVFGPDLTWESRVFWVEILLQAILPVAIFSVPRFRRSLLGLSLGAASAFLGLVMHRIDTGIVGYFRSSEAIYIPNLSEFVLSFGVLSAAGLVFFVLIERFHVLDEPELRHDELGHEVATDLWSPRETRSLLTGAGAMRALRIMVIFIPLTWIVLRDQATSAFTPIPQPVDAAVLSTDEMRTVLHIDGNRNGMSTTFPHKKHHEEFQKVYELEEKDTCIKCHHLNLPNDKNTSCRRCHRDMEIETAMFRIENHLDRFKTEEDYQEFLARDLTDRFDTFAACMKCHNENMNGLAAYDKKGFDHRAPGFKNAMHGSCLTCHRLREQEKKEDPASPRSRGNCMFCHRDWADEGLFEEELVAAAEDEAAPLEGIAGAPPADTD